MNGSRVPHEDLAFFEELRRELYYPGADFESAPGRRVPIIYADATAMGSPLRCLEREIAALLASGDVARIEEAYRATLAELAAGMNAGDEYAFIGVGTGCTGAMNLLFRDILGLRCPDYLHGKGLPEAIPVEERPVFITTSMEHHSADLVLRESHGRETIHLGFAAGGTPDAEELDRLLALHCGERGAQVYVVLSGGSNVTGIQPDLARLGAIARRHGAFLVCDFAAAGPYSKIDLAALGADAVALSPHKFPGGPGTCGLLVIRRRHLATHLYRPPEPNLPAMIEMVRVGRVMKLKARMSIERIRRVVAFYSRLALDRLTANPRIKVLGHTDVSRFAILSFVVRAPYDDDDPTPEAHRPFILERSLPGGHRERYVHHNFIARLLSDRFGAQVRPGCSCAGAYGHWLLQIDPELSQYHRDRIDQGLLDQKPGWVRVTFNEMNSRDEVETVLAAIDRVSGDWTEYAGDYRIDIASGEFVRGDRSLPPVGVGDPAVLADGGRGGYSPAIESFIEREILPRAANTHTETSYTGTISTMWYHWAHQQILKAVGAPSGAVLKFVRAGSRPEHLAIHYLGGAIPPLLKARYGLALRVAPEERPVFFFCGLSGAAERPACFGVIHEVGAVDEILRCAPCYGGAPRFALVRPELGATAADVAGRIAGLRAAGLEVVLDVTGLIAAGEPVDMAGWELAGLIARSDELPGGWQAHPVLILRRDLFRNRLPLDVGGGVVHWTTDQSQRYVTDRTALEDAGTPGIIQGIRTGLVMLRATEAARPPG